MNNENPSYYSILTAHVRYDKNLSFLDKVLFSDITALTNKFGYCTATNKYFSEVFAKSPQTISRSISTLKENGYISTSIEYGENKQILSRKIYVCHKVSISEENDYTPIVKNDHTPIVKNGKGNNTSINNTSIKKNIYTKKSFIDLTFLGITDCENVQLDQKQYDKLVSEYNQEMVKTQIMQLDTYLEDHPKKYKSHYKALRSWLLKESKTKGGNKKYESVYEHNAKYLKSLENL